MEYLAVEQLRDKWPDLRDKRLIAKVVSKRPFIVAADMSRLTFTGFCMRLERTHVRCYKF